MSFYVYLPSNGSQRYFPSNKNSKYRIKTPVKFEFKPNEYEVALTEVSYVPSLKPLSGENNDNKVVIQWQNQPGYEMELPLMAYKTPLQFIDIFNLFVKPDSSGIKPVKLEYVKTRKSVKLNLEQGVTVTLSEKISLILGFDGQRNFSVEVGNIYPCEFFGPMSPNLLAGSFHIFIYCDIVQPVAVGSELVPLLRIINLKSNENDLETTSFQNLYYLPLSRNVFDTISVKLCNEFGEELVLDKGQVTLTLHFRKAQNDNSVQ
jgi:hypothetical protein